MLSASTLTRGQTMPRKNRDADATFDDLIAELEPAEITTSGPSTPPDEAQDITSSPATLEGVGPATLAKMGASDALVRTVRGAIEWGRGQARDKVAAYKGLCLMFVRMCFNVDPLYPDAITAWENADHRRRVTPEAADRGHAGFFRGGTHGHVVLTLGRGLCLTNDTGAPGTINVARIRDIEAAWGYQWLGTTNDLNGESPVPRVRASKPRMTDRQWRIRHLRRAIVRARAASDGARVRRLKRWLTAILGH